VPNRSGVIGRQPDLDGKKSSSYAIFAVETTLRDFTALSRSWVEDVAAVFARIWGLWMALVTILYAQSWGLRILESHILCICAG